MPGRAFTYAAERPHLALAHAHDRGWEVVDHEVHPAAQQVEDGLRAAAIRDRPDLHPSNPLKEFYRQMRGRAGLGGGVGVASRLALQ